MKPLTPRSLLATQDRLLKLLGNRPEGRVPLVAGMLHRNPSEATSYWLQLVVSVGIATLGLVVGSAAVVIGAMLVAPLMGPIIGLAMGLATGSPFLVLRSAGRIGLSVVAAIGGAAIITLLLPFHELNAEISARATPTVLDLITAAFCALAGVYASLRPGSDTATTAAGTSISISLVPPLCASGYGFGTRAWPVAGGASLLFLTNLVAIVAVGTVAFVAAGFNRVDVVALERDELEKDITGARIAGSLARRLARLFESNWGPALRFLMPFVLLAGVYIPLRRALDEVAWQVRVRATVRDALAHEALQVVQSRVRVERREVEVVVVVLGKAGDAEDARKRLDATIRKVSGVVPRIEVLAVPDAAAFAGLESTLLSPHRVETSAAARASPEEQLSASRARVHSTVAQLWPASAAGLPLVIDMGTGDGSPLRIRVVHLGAALGEDAIETIRQAATAALGRAISLVDVAVPAAELTRRDGDLAFVAQVSSAVRASGGIPDIAICVSRPTESPRRRTSPSDVKLGRTLDDILANHPRVVTTPADSWSVRFAVGTCVSPSTDAGVADGGATP